MSAETKRQAAAARPHKQSRLCSLPHKEIQQVQSSRASWQKQGSSAFGKHIERFSPPCVSDVFSACSTAAPSCSSFCVPLFHPRGNTSFLRLFFCSVFLTMLRKEEFFRVEKSSSRFYIFYSPPPIYSKHIISFSLPFLPLLAVLLHPFAPSYFIQPLKRLSRAIIKTRI